jgi:hypothetical protein
MGRRPSGLPSPWTVGFSGRRAALSGRMTDFPRGPGDGLYT